MKTKRISFLLVLLFVVSSSTTFTIATQKTSEVRNYSIQPNDVISVDFILPGNGFQSNLEKPLPFLFEISDPTIDTNLITLKVLLNDGTEINIDEILVVFSDPSKSAMLAYWDQPLVSTGTDSVEEFEAAVNSIVVSHGLDETHTPFPKSAYFTVDSFFDVEYNFNPYLSVNSGGIVPIHVTVNTEMASASETQLYIKDNRGKEYPICDVGSCDRLPSYLATADPLLYESYFSLNWDPSRTAQENGILAHELAHTVQQVVARDRVTGASSSQTWVNPMGQSTYDNPLGIAPQSVSNPLFVSETAGILNPLYQNYGVILDIPYSYLEAPHDRPAPIFARIVHPEYDTSSVQVNAYIRDLATTNIENGFGYDLVKENICSSSCVVDGDISTSFDFYKTTAREPLVNGEDIPIEIIALSLDGRIDFSFNFTLNVKNGNGIVYSEGIHSILTLKDGIFATRLFTGNGPSVSRSNVDAAHIESTSSSHLSIDTHYRGGLMTWSVRPGVIYFNTSITDISSNELEFEFEGTSSVYKTDGHVTVLKGPETGIGALDLIFDPAAISGFTPSSFEEDLTSFRVHTENSGAVLYNQEFGPSRSSPKFFAKQVEFGMNPSAINLPTTPLPLFAKGPFIAGDLEIALNLADGTEILICEGDTCLNADGDVDVLFDIYSVLDPTTSIAEINLLVEALEVRRADNNGTFQVDSFFDIFYSSCCVDSFFDVFFDVTVTDVEDRRANQPPRLHPLNLPLDIYVRFNDSELGQTLLPEDTVIELWDVDGNSFTTCSEDYCPRIISTEGLVGYRIVPVDLYDRIDFGLSHDINQIIIKDTLNRVPDSVFTVDSFFDISYNIERSFEIFIPDETYITKNLRLPAHITGEVSPLNYEEIEVTYLTDSGIDLSELVSIEPSESADLGSFTIVLNIPAMIQSLSESGFKEYSPATEQLKQTPLHISYNGDGIDVHFSDLDFIAPPLELPSSPLRIYSSIELFWNQEWFDVGEGDIIVISAIIKNFHETLGEVPIEDNSMSFIMPLLEPGEFYFELSQIDADGYIISSIYSDNNILSGVDVLEVSTSADESSGNISPDEEFIVKWSPSEEDPISIVTYSIHLLHENGSLAATLSEDATGGSVTFSSLASIVESLGVRLTIQGSNFGKYFVQVLSENGWVSGESAVFSVGTEDGSTKTSETSKIETNSTNNQDSTDAPSLPFSVIPSIFVFVAIPHLIRKKSHSR